MTAPPLLLAALLTSRQELLRTIQSIRPHKDVSDPSKAHKPKTCKCENYVEIDDHDGVGPRCAHCGKPPK